MSEEWFLDNFVLFSFVVGAAFFIVLAIAIPTFLIYRSYMMIRRYLMARIDDEVELVSLNEIDKRSVTSSYINGSEHRDKAPYDTHRHDMPARIYREEPHQ